MTHTLVRPLLSQHEKLNVIGRSKSKEIFDMTGQDGTAGRWLVFDMTDDNDWLFAAKTEERAQQWCAYLNQGSWKSQFDYETLPAGKHRKVSLSSVEAGLKTLTV